MAESTILRDIEKRCKTLLVKQAQATQIAMSKLIYTSATETVHFKKVKKLLFPFAEAELKQRMM